MIKTTLTAIFLNAAFSLLAHSANISIAEAYIIQEPGDGVMRMYPPPAGFQSPAITKTPSFPGTVYITGVNVSIYAPGTYCGWIEVIVRRASDQSLIYYRVFTSSDDDMAGHSMKDIQSLEPDAMLLLAGDYLSFQIAAGNSESGPGPNISLTFPYRMTP
jgi:hypothetical protein